MKPVTLRPHVRPCKPKQKMFRIVHSKVSAIPSTSSQPAHDYRAHSSSPLSLITVKLLFDDSKCMGYESQKISNF